jgi:hypothetical protein
VLRDLRYNNMFFYVNLTLFALFLQISKKSTVQPIESSSSSEEEDSKAGILRVVECQSVHKIRQQERGTASRAVAAVVGMQIFC